MSPSGVPTLLTEGDNVRAEIAHVLRRLTFTPSGERVNALLDGGTRAAIEGLLASSWPEQPPIEPSLGGEDESGTLTKWWVQQMSTTEHPLVERMTWFWHGLLTTSLEKTQSAQQMLVHNQLLRRLALGNFRELLQAVTKDPAMLLWLDGNWSNGEAPNENYAREVMELFALGRGHYSEADVRAAAKGLSGWAVVNDKDLSASYDPERGYLSEVTFLGKKAVFDAALVIDTIVDHPQCARYITEKLYRYLVGIDAATARIDELSSLFRSGGYEIRPVVENIVRHPDFLSLDARYARIRGPVEWRAAAEAALKVPIEWSVLWDFGQVPFRPPNVAGWPDEKRWVTAGPNLLRATVARDHAWDSIVIETDDETQWALTQCAIFDASPETVASIQQSVERVESRRERVTMAISLALVCPEFLLA